MLGIENDSLKNKNVVVAGGSLNALEFVEHAIDADATVSLVCPKDNLCPELISLAANGEIAWLNASPQVHHLDGKIAAFLCHGYDHLIDFAKSKNISRSFGVSVSIEGLPAAFEERIENLILDSISQEIHAIVQGAKALVKAISKRNYSDQDCEAFISKISQLPFDLLASVDSTKVDELAHQFFQEQIAGPIARSPLRRIATFHYPGLLEYRNLFYTLAKISRFFEAKPLIYFDYQHDEYAQTLLNAINEGSHDKAIKLAADSYNSRLIEGITLAGGQSAAFVSSFGAEKILPSEVRTVFHLALRQFDENYIIGYGLDPLFTACSLNNVVLVSNTLQQTHDMTVLSYLLSQFCNLSVVNAYFGVNQLSAKYYQSSDKDLEQLQSIFSDKFDSNYPLDALQYANIGLATISTFFGRKYEFYEYYGKKTCQTVFVSMGIASNAIKRVIETNGPESIGCLHINVYRPWNPVLFAKMLPKNITTLIVVEYSHDNQHGLFNLVSDSFRDITIEKVTFSKDLPDITPLAFSNFLKYSNSALVQVNQLERDDKFDCENIRISVWKYSHESYCSPSFLSGDFLKCGLNAQHYAEHIGTLVEPIQIDYYRVSSNAILSDQVVLKSSALVCASIDFLCKFDIPSYIETGGVLLINTSLDSNEISKMVPVKTSKRLRDNQISVFAVDALSIANNFSLFFGGVDQIITELLEAALLHIINQKMAHLIDFNFNPEIQYERIKKSKPHNLASVALQAIGKALQEIKVLQLAPLNETRTIALPKPLGTVFSSYGKDPEYNSDVQILLKSKSDPVLPVLFKQSFNFRSELRPHLEKTFQVQITENTRLTPEYYDRNVFHMELDIGANDIKYEIGDALGVFPTNDPDQVSRFLAKNNLDPAAIVGINISSTEIEYRTLAQVLTYSLDIFGKPGKAFYQELAKRVQAEAEQAEMSHILNNLDSFAQEETPTFADLLNRFPSAHLTLQEIVDLIPLIKARHYSISSSQRVHQKSIHLLIVLVEWKTKGGEQRYGHATKYLSQARIGEYITVSIKPSVMKLPSSHSAPVVMAGLGTGMAPFRAFIQERWYWKKQGVPIGPMVLYFGSRHRAMEYLYSEELEAYLKDNVLTSIRLAFSRDQPEKIYIQNHIESDSAALNSLLVSQEGSFYLCGPTWPVADVTQALRFAFGRTMSNEKAEHYLENMKSSERFVLEVY